ncbi:MAG: hypothetical protein HY721_00655 [Planctomycetes bacterium]|nr:hypothetical protein [Planctomycetota bacterium]
MTPSRTPKPKTRKKSLPAFRTVEEESEFWDRHSFLDLGAWEPVPYEVVCEELGARKEPKVAVTLRLDKRLVQRLKQAARRHGVKYQALAREILWRSLTAPRR